MNLTCSLECSLNYCSKAQIARVVSETWAAEQMFCAACPSDSLARRPANSRAVDFTCPACASLYQLKSRKTALSNRILDAGYDAMMDAILSERVPNLVLLQYSLSWSVINLLLIPNLFLTGSAIEKRKPLSPNAKRANWIGCNILLGNVPEDGRISIVSNGVIVSPAQVRREYERVQPLRELRLKERGWTLDVLNVLRRLKKRDVSLADFYEFEGQLQALHPNNRNVKPKIRQQLQVLRDLGYLAFEGSGRYRVLG